MHILLAILGVLGAGAFWYFRLKSMGQAASEIADTAGRVRGAYNRRQFRKKVEASTIDAIDDPRIAATVFLVAIASADGRMSDHAEATIKTDMRSVMGVANPDEDLIFAKWAAADIVDLSNFVSRLAKVWVAKLDRAERMELYDLARKVASLENEPDGLVLAALQRLRDRLGLAPDYRLPL